GLAFVIGSVFAAVAGGLFCGHMRYVDPTSFTLAESFFIISVVIVGGAGNVTGPMAGAVRLVSLPEVLRFVPVSDAVAANIRHMLYGLLLIVLLRYRPQGLLGE